MEDRSHHTNVVVAFVCMTALFVVSLVVSLCAFRASNQAKQDAKQARIDADQAGISAEMAVNTSQQALADKTQMPPSPLLPPSVEIEGQLIEGYTLTVMATAYCPCLRCCGIWSEQHPSRIGTDYVQHTSTGTIPTAERTIATDPSVIPMGTHVVINGHEYIAEDTGGGVKGNHIDIFMETHEEAVQWGRQEIEVFVIEE